MGRVEGKTAMITGGASGIGAATAQHLVREGARVVIADLQEEAGQKLAKQLGDAAVFLKLDVSSEEDWKLGMPTAERAFGPLKVLVNAAGISVPAPIEEASFEHWKQTMAVNADGVFLGCRAGVAAMRRSGGGSIVNISSTLGLRGGALFSAYSASKGDDRFPRPVHAAAADIQDANRLRRIGSPCFHRPEQEAVLAEKQHPFTRRRDRKVDGDGDG